MRLIVDGGSTKMEWILLDGNAVIQRFTTEGFNPNYSDIQSLSKLLETQLVAISNVTSIHYYGTGCGNEKNCQKISEVFQNRFPNAEILVTHDLMAACHALFGHEKGIACIMGTGSNSCVYDGEHITEKTVSLGYLVGDEGSGMHIGREVVRAYFYGQMPDDLGQRFDAVNHLELKDFVHRLYHEGQPSKYLASFAKFAGEHQTHPFMHDLVKSCFEAFINTGILRYDDCKLLKVSFVGSVAYCFQDLLKETLKSYGLTMGEALKSPVEGLLRYYKS